MDEKPRVCLYCHRQHHHPHPYPHSPVMHASAARRTARLYLPLLVLLGVVYALWSVVTPLSPPLPLQNPVRVPDVGRFHRVVGPSPSSPSDGAAKVPLEAHIISKCPDTKDALRLLILPAMQKIHNKVDFKLSFIGTPTPDGGVECMHGTEECLGNIIELCARELYPDPKTSLGFVMCLTKDYEDIPEKSLIEDCALEHAIDFDKLNECAARDDGAHGMDILRESVEHSKKVNATTSCTIRLDNKVYCIRDNGEWRDCPHGSTVNELILAVEKLAAGRS